MDVGGEVKPISDRKNLVAGFQEAKIVEFKERPKRDADGRVEGPWSEKDGFGKPGTSGDSGKVDLNPVELDPRPEPLFEQSSKPEPERPDGRIK